MSKVLNYNHSFLALLDIVWTNAVKLVTVGLKTTKHPKNRDVVAEITVADPFL